MKPILFSGPMVRAILDGRKTMTRRVLKAQPVGTDICVHLGGGAYAHAARDGTHMSGQWPTYTHGDILWVREAFNFSSEADLHPLEAPNPKPQRAAYLAKHIVYAADGITEHPVHGRALWKPSIHMPRYASRLTLEVAEVRVQRLQEISESDAEAEGAWRWAQDADEARVMDTPREAFAHLWDSLNAKRGFGWDADPWVVAVSFKPHLQNIDEFLKARGAA